MIKLAAFIMAGGDNRFFPAGMYKQMLAVDGIPIIERTVNLVRSMFNIEPWVVVNSGMPFGVQMRYFYPTNNRLIIDSLQDTSGQWGQENIVLLGDVYYTDKAIKTIRNGDRFAYGKPFEIYGLKFRRNDIVKIMRAIAVARQDAEQGGYGRFWNVYRAWDGLLVNEHRLGPSYYLFPDEEETQDFDRMEQYQKFISNRAKVTA